MAALAGLGGNPEFAAKFADALFDSDQTKAAVAGSGGVEAAAVIVDGDFQVIGGLLQFDGRPLRSGMPGAIGERFLDDAVNAHFVLFGEGLEGAIGLDGNRDTTSFGEVAGLPLEGGEEAEVENGGAEADGEIADGAEGVLGN